MKILKFLNIVIDILKCKAGNKLISPLPIFNKSSTWIIQSSKGLKNFLIIQFH